MKRRDLLGAAWLGSAFGGARADPAAEAALRAGGVVLVMRHALAPGTFDPPGFRLADCSTQRNLSDEGRAQASRSGAWFMARGLTPARVRSSPWCRCVDTATLAFGSAEVWAALSSPTGASESARRARLAELQRALAAVPPAGFEVWVTHQFVITDLVGAATGSGEGLVLRADGKGMPMQVANWPAV